MRSTATWNLLAQCAPIMQNVDVHPCCMHTSRFLTARGNALVYRLCIKTFKYLIRAACLRNWNFAECIEQLPGGAIKNSRKGVISKQLTASYGSYPFCISTFLVAIFSAISMKISKKVRTEVLRCTRKK